MKDLMEQVFGTLYERDSKALKKIIEAYGYFDEDEDETGEVEPESTKQLLNLLKEFKETRKDEFTDCLVQLGYIHDERSEIDKTIDYGKLFIDNQIIKAKSTVAAIEIVEKFRINSLIPDGEETVIALCKTNQEQLIDTINTNLGTEELVRLLIGTVGLSKVEDEIKFYQGIKTNTLALDLTNIRYAAETILNNEGLRKEIKRIKKERKNE